MVTIKEMEMPKNCDECQFGCITYNNNRKCKISENCYTVIFTSKERPTDCPLVEIVTCKDCKHWQRIKDYHGRCKLFDEVWKGNSLVPIEHGTNEEFYCQMAERRE